MRRLGLLFTASVVTLMFSLAPSAGAKHLHAGGGETHAGGGETPPPALSVECERPRTLLLRRFEDRSAQLWCDGGVIVRVAVPG
jgi:hypothetical protein